jgi:hypothetical protein
MPFDRTRATLFALAVGLLFGALLRHPLFGQVTGQITIEQVFGLVTELGIRPIMGSNVTPGSVAYFDQNGFLETVTGPASNCVTVAGLATPCGTSSAGTTGTSINFADSEVPSGAINGSNTTFALAHVPNPPTSLHLYRNGLRLSAPGDYAPTVSTGGIVLTIAPSGTDQLTADYRY